jgi:hypothetical protein
VVRCPLEQLQGDIEVLLGAKSVAKDQPQHIVGRQFGRSPKDDTLGFGGGLAQAFGLPRSALGNGPDLPHQKDGAGRRLDGLHRRARVPERLALTTISLCACAVWTSACAEPAASSFAARMLVDLAFIIHALSVRALRIRS